MKCPWCEETNSSKPIKDWTFAQFFVLRFSCGGCGQKYNIYYRDGQVVFTLPKTGREESDEKF